MYLHHLCVIIITIIKKYSINNNLIRFFYKKICYVFAKGSSGLPVSGNVLKNDFDGTHNT